MATSGKNLSEYDKATMPEAGHLRFGIVVSEWNPEITDALASGAYDTLLDLGADPENITKMHVPGSFELPAGCRILLNRGGFDALIAIGVVIQGETRHFDFVCHGVTQGIAHLNVSQDVPVIFCVLTDNTIEQSRARAGGKHGNKGIEAAVAAVKMASLKRDF